MEERNLLEATHSDSTWRVLSIIKRMQIFELPNQRRRAILRTVQQSIEVKVPVHAAYECLTHFEEYPSFMEDVETVRRIDSTHLQWVTRMDNRPVEWSAEITEQEPDRCIAWHNTTGPTNCGKLELQPLDEAHSRITFTWQLEPEQVPGPKAGDPEDLMSQRLKEDLGRMKHYVEVSGGASLQQGQGSGASPQMRHIGEMPQDTTMEQHGGVPTSDAAGKRVSVSEPWNAPMSGRVSQSTRDNTSSTQHPTSGPPDKGTAAVVGSHGGTDAAAGAQLSGSKGGPGGTSPRQNEVSGAPGNPGGTVESGKLSPAAGAAAAGGTGLGSAATADDTRTGTGTSSGAGTTLTGGGLSGTRGPGIGSANNNGGRP